MNNKPYIVILAGGEGIRFAPLSTPERPKQFMNIVNPHRSMLQETWDRVSLLTEVSRIFVSTNLRYVSLVQAQLPQLPKENIIAEPLKKNTAPAMAYICALIAKQNPEAVVLFLPSDHFIENAGRAREIFQEAISFAGQQNKLITFGIVPTESSPHYGYICASPKKQGLFAHAVNSFVEKPTIELAQSYLRAGNYFWNSGMFVWKASFFLEELNVYCPEMFALLQQKGRADGSTGSPCPGLSIQAFFERVPSVSVDYAVMEKSKNVSVFPFNAGWSDVGTWNGLKNLAEQYAVSLPESVQSYLITHNPPTLL